MLDRLLEPPKKRYKPYRPRPLGVPGEPGEPQQITMVGNLKIVGPLPTEEETRAALGWQTATPRRAALIQATRESGCPVCGFMVTPGEWIVRDHLGDWVHQGCA